VPGARRTRGPGGACRVEGEREFVRRTFGRYLTEQVVQELLDSPDGLKLGGQRAFVTIMMTDLRGFTSMCGSMVPKTWFRLLNHYLETMTRIIARYGGTIDEFIGDAILVVFGAPLPIEKAETRAVACAIEMLNAMGEVNGWNAEHGLPAVEMASASTAARWCSATSVQSCARSTASSARPSTSLRASSRSPSVGRC